ncbi:SGNH/GDSL hydrolase family protein [Aeromicrobium sp.]|nr:SGNH/GDSL hydrolase family protein [Candidatus Saccharibacteria bacterium]
MPRRPGGKFLRTGAVFLRGVRMVQNQIVPHAQAWQQHNRQVLDGGDEPLWVVLGDSMAQGVGAKHFKDGWVGQLDTRLKKAGKQYRLLNLSISGARIRDVMDYQLPELEALGDQPELITVLIGSNDMVRKKYRVNALADFDELLEVLPVGTVIGNILGGKGVPIAMDMRLQRAVQARGLIVADIRRNGPQEWKGLVAEDFFHPNERGYRILADVFALAIGLPAAE